MFENVFGFTKNMKINVKAEKINRKSIPQLHVLQEYKAENLPYF